MARGWDDEAEAEAVVLSKVGGNIRGDRDPGGGAHQVRDFLVETVGGDLAFEVTRHTDGNQEATLAAVDARSWTFPELRYDWLVGMRPSYDVRNLHKHVVDLFTRLEESETTAAHLVYDDDVQELDQELVGALRSAGIKYLRRCELAGTIGGQLSLNVAGSGGTTSPDLLVELAEREAQEADNLTKLRSAIADERHLFVWVDSKQSHAAAAFAFDLPEKPPRLPDGVDAVWLVETLLPARVWQYHRALGWHDLGRWRG